MTGQASNIFTKIEKLPKMRSAASHTKGVPHVATICTHLRISGTQFVMLPMSSLIFSMILGSGPRRLIDKSRYFDDFEVILGDKISK